MISHSRDQRPRRIDWINLGLDTASLIFPGSFALRLRR